jgi:hypothetical protein
MLGLGEPKSKPPQPDMSGGIRVRLIERYFHAVRPLREGVGRERSVGFSRPRERIYRGERLSMNRVKYV